MARPANRGSLTLRDIFGGTGHSWPTRGRGIAANHAASRCAERTRWQVALRRAAFHGGGGTLFPFRISDF